MWKGDRLAITPKTRDDRNSSNPSALKFVETHGGTNAIETLTARLDDREWCRLFLSNGIRSDRQSDSIPCSLDGSDYLRRRRFDGRRVDHGKESQFHKRHYRGQRRARP